MTVQKLSPVYKCSDGRDFPTEAEAERHEALKKADAEFREARRLLGMLLVESQQTADGQPFVFGVFTDYYHVTPSWYGMPDLKMVSFSRYDFDFDDWDRFTILITRDDRKVDRYPVAELYADRAKAERALLAAQEEWLAERAAEVAELRRRLA